MAKRIVPLARSSELVGELQKRAMYQSSIESLSGKSQVWSPVFNYFFQLPVFTVTQCSRPDLLNLSADRDYRKYPRPGDKENLHRNPKKQIDRAI